jgi:hypothetical protein
MYAHMSLYTASKEQRPKQQMQETGILEQIVAIVYRLDK